MNEFYLEYDLDVDFIDEEDEAEFKIKSIRDIIDISKIIKKNRKKIGGNLIMIEDIKPKNNTNISTFDIIKLYIDSQVSK